jgi:hypothetical protein
MSSRKARLIDCNPKWVTDGWIRFDCPEGHKDCVMTLPVTPRRDGAPHLSDGAVWRRQGDDFATMTITPSIRRSLVFANREEALAKGAIAEHLRDGLFCAMHVNIINGQFQYSGDSR